MTTTRILFVEDHRMSLHRLSSLIQSVDQPRIHVSVISLSDDFAAAVVVAEIGVASNAALQSFEELAPSLNISAGTVFFFARPGQELRKSVEINDNESYHHSNQPV